MSEQNGTQLQTSRHAQLLMEVEVKSNTKRQLVVEFQMQQWCIVTLSLPRPCLWPLRECLRDRPRPPRENAPILRLSFSIYHCSIHLENAPFCAYLSQHIISLFCARPTFLTRSMPFSFSCPSINLCMCLSFLNQSFPFSV